MRLGKFIESNIDPILADWELFARSVWPKNSPADPVELRDHAEQIVRAFVVDMAQTQSASEQSQKAKGQGVSGNASDRLDDASAIHGISRVGSGLTLLELVAEYRALRASILRQWQASKPEADALDLHDITRFNEAIDQSLTHAIASFTRRVDESRKMFLAILGHDLRSPLSAISLCATLAKAPEADEERSELLTTVISSAEAIGVLLTDLIDFTSATLGVRMPLTVGPADLPALCRDVAAEVRGANPGREVRVVVKGDVGGKWDARRLRQVITNLLGNAVQHGTADEPVTLTVDGTKADTVVIAVHNGGTPIPTNVLPTIFDPLVRGRSTVEKRHRPGSIGLGLYIAREITVAHGGTIAVTSTAADGTTATVRLPRA